jgi:putative adhesin
MRAPWRVISSLRRMALVVAATTVPAFAGDEGHFDCTLAVTGAVDRTVESDSGAIAARRGSSSKVEIHGTIHADHWHVGGDVEARIHEIEMNSPSERSGNTIRLGHFDNHNRERSISISYELNVPAESKLRAESDSGGQTVEGIHGPVDANSGSGSQRFANIGGEVGARAGSGEIELNSISGSVHATAGRGTIRAIGIAGGLTASSGSGSLHAQGQTTSEWRLRSGSGNVTAERPKGAAFDLIARSSSGHMETSHELNGEGTINRSKLFGKANGGGVLVDLNTSSGSINIRKTSMPGRAVRLYPP